MKSEIISVGTELLLGDIVNSNAQFLAQELRELGINVYYQSVVGDNETRLKEVFSRSLERCDLVILTGGLGPTKDDLTKEAVAKVLGLEMEKNSWWEEKLEEFFQKRKRPMAEVNRKQAWLFKGSTLLPNPNGTAPGIFWENSDTRQLVILLPGPPRELQTIFLEEVVPRLREKLEGTGELGVLKSNVLRTVGIGESALVDKIKPVLEKQKNPTIAPLAKLAEVHLRISAWAEDVFQADKMLAEKKGELKEILGDYIYGEDEEELEEVVAKMLWEKNLSLALAESCTGGFLSSRLTNIPGSSNFLQGSMVTYSDEAKIKLLEVNREIINKNGAVSSEVAIVMAENARKIMGSDVGLGITGIAGPGGGTEEKPVGLTYIALSAEDKKFCRDYRYWGNRQEIKTRVTQGALEILRRYLMGKLL